MIRADRPASLLGECASRENIHDAFDEIDELLEAWDNRLTVDNLSLAKRYIEGELKIAFEFSLWVGAEAPRKNYIAVIQRILDLSGSKGDWRELGHYEVGGQASAIRVHSLEAGQRIHFPQKLGVRSPDRDQGGMLIEDVQLVQTPEGVCPSFVWLKALDHDLGIGRDPFQVFGRHAIEDLFGGTYWEVGVLELSAARDPICYGKRSGQRIEGGPEVVDYIPDNRPPAIGDLFDEVKLRMLVSRLRLSVGDDFIGLSPVVGDDLGFEVTKMLLGPVNLGYGAG
ncbi:MAG: hypothetical protein E5X07_28415 [Mesorhizobium sp.]|uniref:hypothetical protein n=1 Tax=Mesorhizobium sp. TaxID=1871066 RepID=UPI00120CAAAD|nr:hypothetical protein [Mesorhizobium sp.]TIR27199.1 MAG: hypothetical protein E5X35_33580 [Mesorhizobium sp.]TIS19423.1 MAG: hypothetical protein E5X07_28415 [Mesorhizobium sp.]